MGKSGGVFRIVYSQEATQLCIRRRVMVKHTLFNFNLFAPIAQAQNSGC